MRGVRQAAREVESMKLIPVQEPSWVCRFGADGFLVTRIITPLKVFCSRLAIHSCGLLGTMVSAARLVMQCNRMGLWTRFLQPFLFRQPLRSRRRTKPYRTMKRRQTTQHHGRAREGEGMPVHYLSSSPKPGSHLL